MTVNLDFGSSVYLARPLTLTEKQRKKHLLSWWREIESMPSRFSEAVLRMMKADQITAANAEKRPGFAGKSRVGLSPRPGVAEFCRSVA